MQTIEITGLEAQEVHVILPPTICVMLNKLPWLFHLLSAILSQIVSFSGRDEYERCQHRHPLKPCWDLWKCCSSIITPAFSPRALKVIREYSCCSIFRCRKRYCCYSCIVQSFGFEGVQRFAGSCFSHVATLLSITESACVPCQLYHTLQTYIRTSWYKRENYQEVALITTCFSCLLSYVYVCGSPLPIVSKLLFTALKSSAVAIKGNFVCARYSSPKEGPKIGVKERTVGIWFKCFC